jgi:hypothetical protein
MKEDEGYYCANRTIPHQQQWCQLGSSCSFTHASTADSRPKHALQVTGQHCRHLSSSSMQACACLKCEAAAQPAARCDSKQQDDSLAVLIIIIMLPIKP